MFTRLVRAHMLASASLLMLSPSFAQQLETSLPVIDVAAPSAASGALTSPDTEAARSQLERTPGAVSVTDAQVWRSGSVSNTIKDMLDYVPGVFAQPKWGDDTRLSIRGSGLSRNFHLRGVQLYQDGIPLNTADGYGDFQEIDATAYRYMEVFKGANALRFGANALGGAINFVTPTGRDSRINSASIDAGAFGFRRIQASVGGTNGAWDGFVTASTQAATGFRDHSAGHATRVSGNVGYRFSEDAETRFYLNAGQIRQEIPGSVSKEQALTNPRRAASGNLTGDYRRDIDVVRLANKTTLRFGDTVVDFGAFVTDRRLIHPIFQVLDYRYQDFGAFARVTDEREIAGHRNRFIAGVNLHNGRTDNRQFANVGGNKGRLMSSSIDRSRNVSVYLENSFEIVRNVSLVAGTQFLHATRDRADRLTPNGGNSGRTSFDLWSPKVGVLWQVDPSAQVYANVSRSAEVPSFGESAMGIGIPTIPFTQIRPQTATTYEIGTRGRRQDLTWELTFYRMNIQNELLCLYSAFGNCNVTNADRTVHQGIEAGLGIAVLKDVFAAGGGDTLWLNASYTFNDFRFNQDAVFGNNQLPGAPRHYLRAELLYKHANGFFIGPNVEVVPEGYFVDSANTLASSAYALVGLKAGIDNGGPWSGYIEARNIADVKYIASASILDRAAANAPLFEPGTGRAVYAGVHYRW